MAVVITPLFPGENLTSHSGALRGGGPEAGMSGHGERDVDRGMERKESETSRDGERQQVMEGGVQMGNEMSWEFWQIKEHVIQRSRARKYKVAGQQK